MASEPPQAVFAIPQFQGEILPMPGRPNNVVELFPAEPWSYQDFRAPVVTGEPARMMFFIISVMAAEAYTGYASMSPEDVFGWWDQLQEMLRRPELLAQFLDEAGLTAIAGYYPAFVAPGFWASTPPPQAA